METLTYGAQLRMARAGLGWSLRETASRAKVGLTTIHALEAEDGPTGISNGPEHTRASRREARQAVVDALRKTLTAAGITFLDDDGSGPGIRVKLAAPKPKRKAAPK
jgi:transcriptional regulator with XRE-family HTH domain